MSTRLDPLTISADLLYAVKTGGDVAGLRDRLATLERERLSRALASRRQRLVFWLNCYNAYVQLRLDDGPSLDDGPLSRWRFFARDWIPIAGRWLSLDDVEHGLLRSSKHPWGLGYLPRPFPSSFERTYRLEEVDPRIHFVLSKGTDKSPPVTVYSPDDCNEELDVATEWFLDENVSYDPNENVVTVPRLFLWYQGDFGGRRGVLEFLRRYDAVPPDATPSLAYD
ncbi:DUF547 domain-containing protein [Natribaculum luteum]|uniref:DUF547 domain-containing protein n=1 Tax=Natribaculum luteum TaxID=1586232 RepID=A0ABD5P2Y1_9EURY|nr:DUF547 domain-containing protein [Natribaculum luteum]